MNFENVQPGDTLIWHCRDIKRLTIVDRITDHFKFRKSDGFQIYLGKLMYRSQVTIPKIGEIEKIRDLELHRKLVGKINDACQLHCLRKLPLETLEKLNSVLDMK